MDKRSCLIVLLIFSLSFASATCTVSFDKDEYIVGETVSAQMSCSSATEKSKAYTLTWTYQNGTLVETDTGTTPSTISQNFYETYTIPTGWPNGVFVNVTLTGDNLEGTDFANVSTTAGTNSLVITNIGVGEGYVGRKTSLKAIVKDENGKKISGGVCRLGLLNNDETSVRDGTVTTITDGGVKSVFELSSDNFKENTDYTFHIHCFCGSDGSSQECINEDGIAVENSVGSATFPFTTETWLTVNTLTDDTVYGLKDEVFVCANVTNVNYSSRIPLHIFYELRCSAGSDNSNDTDRILIAYNDPSDPDTRGISVNTTQMQCRKFQVPEEFYLMGRNSECYASSEVWVLDATNEKIFGYATTSPVFNISSNEINLEADWAWTSDTRLGSIVNLSEFNDLAGEGTGNIDVRLFVGSKVNLQNIFNIANIIENVTVENTTTILTHHTDYELEFLEDGYVELEIRNTNLSSNWFNITLDFYDTELRQTLALEGIENKTGTFHLDVQCPSSSPLGEDMNCSITAQVEDEQTVQKEVDFTCHISDGTNTYSEVNFNQMVTQTPVTLYQTFLVPSNLTNGQQYILQCYADYFNVGSRRDSFYDTFIAGTISSSSSGGSSSSWTNPGEEPETSPITGGAISETGESPIIEWFKNEDGSPNYLTISILAIFLAAICITLILIHSKKESRGKPKSKLYTEIVVGGLIALGIVAGLSIIYLGYTAIKAIIIKIFPLGLSDPLFRAIILVTFIAAIVIIIAKSLNLQVIIKMGHKDPIREYWKKKN